MKPKKYNSGFTLIELLVVIAIIGLLASIVLVALNTSRQKSRIAKRVADLNQIATALELYYNDNNNVYPLSNPGDNPGGNWRTQCAGWFYTTNFIPGMVSTYMSKFPVDPAMVPASNQNCYLYLSNGTDYKVLDYNLTDMTLAQVSQYPALKDPARNDAGNVCGYVDGTLSFAVYSPGGRCW